MSILNHKSLLAKLLATEDISVETHNVSTASFDLKNRTLILPNWENVSEHGYDLLVGHEVGHALDTPFDSWKSAVSENTKLKSFINVVEDARIEKRIKRKYPGLRSSFNIGYAEFLKKDIFGIGNRDINEMYFIDRLNIHTKTGVLSSVRFSTTEMELVDLVEKAETFEQVVSVAKLIYEFSKEEQKESDEDSDSNYDENFVYDFDDQSESDEGLEESESESVVGQEESESESGEGQEESSSGQSTDKNVDCDDFEPVCETDESFERNRAELSRTDSKENYYAKLPSPILKNIVTPATRVQELLSNHFDRFPDFVNEKYSSFTKRNSRYIDLLAKEFEMRKAAKTFAKSKISNTGDLDLAKIYKYKTDDNIFRRIMTVPNGKNHGIVILLDRSGSMSGNMQGALEQLVVLSQFCKKVGIPFIVYGFGNNINGRKIDYPVTNDGGYNCFSNLYKEISLKNVYLREYLNSTMSQSAFTRSCKNIIALSTTYGAVQYANREYITDNGEKTIVCDPIKVPDQEFLSYTPLNESLVALAPIAKQFKNRYKLDIVNTVIIQDGDADDFGRSVNDSEYKRYENRLIVVDKVNNQVVQIDASRQQKFQSDILRWYTTYTESKAIGFFIANEKQLKGLIHNWAMDDIAEKMVDRSTLLAGYQNELKQKRFIARDVPSYNKFFYLSGGSNLISEQDELDINSEMSVSRMKTAFLKNNQSKQVNRALVTRFMEIISV